MLRCMRFPHFWHDAEPSEPGDGLPDPQDWADSGVADEVIAFLAGRLVDHLVATSQPVPPWAVINRLAHADRAEIVRLVEGLRPLATHQSGARCAWTVSERFIAGHLLAAAPTPEDLRRLQQASLVPLELDLIDRGAVDRLTADLVMAAASDALDAFLHGR